MSSLINWGIFFGFRVILAGLKYTPNGIQGAMCNSYQTWNVSVMQIMCARTLSSLPMSWNSFFDLE